MISNYMQSNRNRSEHEMEMCVIDVPCKKQQIISTGRRSSVLKCNTENEFMVCKSFIYDDMH